MEDLKYRPVGEFLKGLWDDCTGRETKPPTAYAGDGWRRGDRGGWRPGKAHTSKVPSLGFRA